jgi:cardiolipin synthase
MEGDIMLKHIPNTLTLFRLALIPAFIYFYFLKSPEHIWTPLVIFITATITDVLDGYIARRFELITKIGTVLDPLADKLMLITVLLCLYIDRRIPLFVIVIVIIKELFMIASGVYLYFIREKIVIPSNKIGKAATVGFSLAIVLILFNLPDSLTVTLILIAISIKIGALMSYIKTYRTLHRKRIL